MSFERRLYGMRDSLKPPRRLRHGGGALIIIFVLWLTGAHPAVAFIAKFGLETEACFASMPSFVPISNPADAVAVDTRSLACGGIDNLPIRIHFGPKFLSAQDFGKSSDYRALNVDGEAGTHKYFASNLDVLRDGFTDVEAQYGGSNPIIPINFRAGNFHGVNFDLRAVSGDEFFASKFSILSSQSGLFFCGNPEGEGESRNRDSRERSEKSIVLINETQRADRLRSDDSDDGLALIIGVFGGILAGLLAYAGLKRGCDLVFGPNKYE
jgi:hypothetical protein